MRTLDEATPQLNPTKLNRFCNKPTTLYIAPSGQRNKYCPLIIFGCIYKQWFLHYNNEPTIEFGHFFADPVLITSNGPKTVVEIVRSHKLLCDQACQLLDQLGRGDILSDKNYKLLPLCRAILDELDQDVEEDEDGRVSLDEYSQAQSVLMVRTGDESHLSAPITFEQIKAQTLPLRRDDCILEGIEVVRVSLKTAVSFITNLTQREEATFLSEENGHVIDRSLCPADWRGNYSDLSLSADVCAERILQEADELGFENVVSARNAFRRVMAARRGDESAQLTPVPFDRSWK
jgi:hypothetical protein